MSRLSITAATITILLLGTAVIAAADEVEADRPVPAADAGLELSLGVGYTHATGDIQDHAGSLTDVSGAGGSAEAHLHYRINPKLSIGAYGSVYHAGVSGLVDDDVLGMTAGLESTWHFRPGRSIDPWITSGGGWRGTWLQRPGMDTTLHGLDMLHLQVGVDYRFDKHYSLSPYLGVAATKYLAEKSERTVGYDDVEDSKLTWTFSAGLLARFGALGAE